MLVVSPTKTANHSANAGRSLVNNQLARQVNMQPSKTTVSHTTHSPTTSPKKKQHSLTTSTSSLLKQAVLINPQPLKPAIHNMASGPNHTIPLSKLQPTTSVGLSSTSLQLLASSPSRSIQMLQGFNQTQKSCLPLASVLSPQPSVSTSPVKSTKSSQVTTITKRSKLSPVTSPSRASSNFHSSRTKTAKHSANAHLNNQLARQVNLQPSLTAVNQAIASEPNHTSRSLTTSPKKRNQLSSTTSTPSLFKQTERANLQSTIPNMAPGPSHTPLSPSRKKVLKQTQKRPTQHQPSTSALSSRPSSYIYIHTSSFTFSCEAFF